MGKKEQRQLLQPDLHSLQEIKVCIFGSFVFLFWGLMTSSCANKGVISGGEKDTIPPELMSTVPFNQSLDYKGTEILLTFDERVQAQQLQRKLLITPFTDTQYKVKVNRNVVQLSFEEGFRDSTTFTLNFADAITDVTENNPGKNVVIAFSTWHIIDSLSISGKVVDLMSNEPVESAAVSLYEATDTLDIFSGKPYYFAITDEDGRFFIQNMKGGYYRFYAFKDDNGNYLNEPDSEYHGFISDTLQLESISDSLTIPLILQDVQELKLVNTRSNGNHFDVRYNKYIHSYSFEAIDSLDSPFESTIIAENQGIRFYERPMQKDSSGYYLTANDSVGNSRTDTVYIKFTDRELRPAELTVELNPKNADKILEDLEIRLMFSKPIISINHDSLLVKYDTLKTELIDSIGSLTWNWNKTELKINAQLDKNYLTRTVAEHRILQDSLAQLDSLNAASPDSVVSRPRQKEINTNLVQFYFGKGAFVSVENDSSEIIQPMYEFKQEEKFGKISGTVAIDSAFFVIQLVNEKFETLGEIINQQDYLFDYVPPGKYNVRVLVDTNGDGRWSYGNIKKGIEPEKVFLHSTFIELRENWEINNINLAPEL